MEISSYLKPGNIILDIESQSIEEISERFIRLLLKPLVPEENLEKAVRECLEATIAREKYGCTWEGTDVVCPYPAGLDADYMKEPLIGIGISKKGIRWYFKENPEKNWACDELVHFIIFTIIPDPGQYCVTMGKVNRLFHERRVEFIQAKSPDEVTRIVKDWERKRKESSRAKPE